MDMLLTKLEQLFGRLEITALDMKDKRLVLQGDSTSGFSL